MKQLLSGGDQYNAKNELLVGNVVTNAMFQFPRGAPILELALNTVKNIFTWIFFTEIFSPQVSSVYDPASWVSVGPDLLQRSLLTLCGFPPSQPLRDFAMTRTHFRSGSQYDNCGPLLLVGVVLLCHKTQGTQSPLIVNRVIPCLLLCLYGIRLASMQGKDLL